MNDSSSSGFSHLDETGQAQMVDVQQKEPTKRRAKAKCKVLASQEVLKKLQEGSIKKGDVLAVAKIAGIQAAKKTAELIPLCHPLKLGFVSVEFATNESEIEITATAEAVERTGVEMEALTACSVAALTIYDMCKALDRSISITDIHLVEKTGGKSGDYHL